MTLPINRWRVTCLKEIVFSFVLQAFVFFFHNCCYSDFYSLPGGMAHFFFSGLFQCVCARSLFRLWSVWGWGAIYFDIPPPFKPLKRTVFVEKQHINTLNVQKFFAEQNYNEPGILKMERGMYEKWGFKMGKKNYRNFHNMYKKHTKQMDTSSRLSSYATVKQPAWIPGPWKFKHLRLPEARSRKDQSLRCYSTFIGSKQ